MHVYSRAAKKENQAYHYNKHIIKATQAGITPRLISKNALSVVEKLNRQGHEAYIVGGCLRDILLGKRPKDFDVATDARPEQIQTIFQRQCRLVGRRFRLAHIMFGRDIIEVATFRANHTDNENEHHAKRNEDGMLLRDNVYGDLEQDAERRDFTVNALYYNPRDNTLHDHFNGLEDLKAGRLRLIG
ncbi:MAG TPA: poly(A) polymerase, partial [Pasteurellaceae bacterium]|nr:poly(A) polymerase [Pasteurellaceae bacterium]